MPHLLTIQAQLTSYMEAKPTTRPRQPQLPPQHSIFDLHKLQQTAVLPSTTSQPRALVVSTCRGTKSKWPLVIPLVDRRPVRLVLWIPWAPTRRYSPATAVTTAHHRYIRSGHSTPQPRHELIGHPLSTRSRPCSYLPTRKVTPAYLGNRQDGLLPTWTAPRLPRTKTPGWLHAYLGIKSISTTNRSGFMGNRLAPAWPLRPKMPAQKLSLGHVDSATTRLKAQLLEESLFPYTDISKISILATRKRQKTSSMPKNSSNLTLVNPPIPRQLAQITRPNSHWRQSASIIAKTTHHILPNHLRLAAPRSASVTMPRQRTKDGSIGGALTAKAISPVKGDSKGLFWRKKAFEDHSQQNAQRLPIPGQYGPDQ